jgi:hypothetical protein
MYQIIAVVLLPFIHSTRNKIVWDHIIPLEPKSKTGVSEIALLLAKSYSLFPNININRIHSCPYCLQVLVGVLSSLNMIFKCCCTNVGRLEEECAHKNNAERS